MYCIQCGSEARSEARFCWKCGGKLSTAVEHEFAENLSSSTEGADASRKPQGGIYHPWRRFFARLVDISTLGIFVPILLLVGLSHLVLTDVSALTAVLDMPFVAGFVVLVLWIPQEAFLLCRFGTTPAKWLFGVSVASQEGGHPSFGQALQRSSLVTIFGVAFLIPVVERVAEYLAYRRLTKTGSTLWDTYSKCVVQHSGGGAARTVACVIVAIPVLVLNGVLSAAWLRAIEDAQLVALYPKVERQMQDEVARAREARLANLSPEMKTLLNEVTNQMIQIPAGSYSMGCSPGDSLCDGDEKPVHSVNVRAFRLGKYEVTFAQYDAFAAATGRDKPSDSGWGRGNRPVIYVSWEDAQAYANWLSELTGLRFRLPSEAEWEYAARAGTTTEYSWGNEPGGNQANCGSDCQDDFHNTAPVGSFQPNAFGLFDMHGNVWESVQDNWHEDYSGAPTDGSVWAGGDASRRVLRGGSWNYAARYLRASYRYFDAPTLRSSFGGFRVAQDL